MKTRRDLILGSLCALATVAPRPASAQADEPLRVGSNLGDPYAEAYFAQDAGFFKREGLAPELPVIAQGGTMAAAVAGGTLEIAITTPVSIASAYLRGLPLTIVAAGCVSTAAAPATPLYVARDAPLRSVRDLAGKTIALNGLRALSEVALDAWLERGGVKPADVRLVEMTFSQMGPAIARGAIDAAMIAEPASSIAVATNGLRVLADPYQAISPQTLVSAWFTTQAFAQRRPDVVRRFAAAIYATARWANANHERSAAILAKHTAVDPETMRTMVRSQYAEAYRPALLQPELDAAATYGVLPRRCAAADLVYRG